MSERWTYKANSQGWSLYLDGVWTEGARTSEPFKGRGAAKQAKQYADYARAECARRNATLKLRSESESAS